MSTVPDPNKQELLIVNIIKPVNKHKSGAWGSLLSYDLACYCTEPFISVHHKGAALEEQQTRTDGTTSSRRMSDLLCIGKGLVAERVQFQFIAMNNRLNINFRIRLRVQREARKWRSRKFVNTFTNRFSAETRDSPGGGARSVWSHARSHNRHHTINASFAVRVRVRQKTSKWRSWEFIGAFTKEALGDLMDDGMDFWARDSTRKFEVIPPDLSTGINAPWEIYLETCKLLLNSKSRERFCGTVRRSKSKEAAREERFSRGRTCRVSSATLFYCPLILSRFIKHFCKEHEMPRANPKIRYSLSQRKHQPTEGIESASLPSIPDPAGPRRTVLREIANERRNS
ncbi:hypothetical protein EAG_03329 [Camponotus floridanus]|uniref:Uncharacterized protein n=1 Tax=Camponotus floridanus TaxID=104421 RepID=E1ZWT0_CAMFO|nr:hypothetical protein EAG_03329 [Camponotus floridanus]